MFSKVFYIVILFFLFNSLQAFSSYNLRVLAGKNDPSPEKCKKAVSDNIYFGSDIDREKESFFKTSDLQDAALSVLARNRLRQAKIKYLWELTSKTEAELLELRVGKKSSERN